MKPLARDPEWVYAVGEISGERKIISTEPCLCGASSFETPVRFLGITDTNPAIYSFREIC